MSLSVDLLHFLSITKSKKSTFLYKIDQKKGEYYTVTF